MAVPMVTMPTSWSNKDRIERLRQDAFESMTRMLNRAVAETCTNFQIWDALRTTQEQHDLFVTNYRNTGKTYPNGDRSRLYKGTYWARKPGSVAVAVPGSPLANHESGVAVDIHPRAIQDWIITNGLRFGWSWAEGKRNGERWHFRYYPDRDQYRGEGPLDHAAVQRAVGADVDGKIGTGTITLIKEFQRKHGLEADGKVGPTTKQAMGLSGKADAPPAAPAPVMNVPTTAAELTIEVPGDSPNANQERFGEDIEHITIHWWGTPTGQTHDGTVRYLLQDRGTSGTSAHYVVSPGRVSRCVPEEWTAWSSGKRAINRRDISIEGDPNDPVGTLPTMAALVADIWARRGELELKIHKDHTSTLCPGDYEDLMDELEALARGLTVDLPVTTTPAPAATVPTGKALIMALIAAPDFPLLRTSKHLCYYGGDNKQEAVSGKVPNSLVPGEIFGSGKTSGAYGLKAWQKRMQERGYSLEADGRYGPATAKAAKNLQRLAGITQDGKIGPDAWYAAFLLPVVS